jgi:formylglycine-generating enzyme required for sulfatase activity
MVVVPAGSFMMGSPAGEEGRFDNEGPQRKVTIARPFAVSKYEVTRGEFAKFVAATGHEISSGCHIWDSDRWTLRPDRGWRFPGFTQNDRHPVVCVSWDDARAYASWLSARVGRPYRLLTEAEWEYAARAGSTTRYHFGDAATDFCADAKISDPSAKAICGGALLHTAPVGAFSPNAFGLHDMHGNVQEWVHDCWNGDHQGAPTEGSARTSGDCSIQVLRGGSWLVDPRYRRSAARVMGHTTNPGGRNVDIGFRLARTLD